MGTRGEPRGALPGRSVCRPANDPAATKHKKRIQKQGRWSSIKSRPLIRAYEVDVRLGKLTRRRHSGPVLGVMISIEESEYCMVHISVRRTAGDIENIEFNCL